ncbi:hypothetical protein NDU88_006071 [Pleurodeles waltl]|uniref:Integrase catalytic domain-containing protein n=1 Tax=Pleurodeles waltl TaxID=8319 RepID=A0AAV7L350_PLEWA|nr:hypothetical protein NDU88_006071 [Pleurodeles waltl]
MTEICQSLGVTQIRTSVYHPQTDQFVERYNKTIKNLLRKAINDTVRDWDKKLPLVLYAIRTHIQSSTGYSPFELLFGRQPRTILHMTAEQWEEMEEETKVILNYTRELKETLHSVWEDVHSQLEEAQKRQKAHYDLGTKIRDLPIDKKVLILLPTTEIKLLARWQGPYTVIEQVTPVTHRIEIPAGANKSQICHNNLLKPWHENEDNNRNNGLNLCITTTQNLDILVFPTRVKPDQVVEPHYGSELTTSQRKHIEGVIQTHQEVFSRHPGRTHLIKHHIRTIDGKVA